MVEDHQSMLVLSREGPQELLGISGAAGIASWMDQDSRLNRADSEGLGSAQESPHTIISILVGDEKDDVVRHAGSAENTAGEECAKVGLASPISELWMFRPADDVGRSVRRPGETEHLLRLCDAENHW